MGDGLGVVGRYGIPKIRVGVRWKEEKGQIHRRFMVCLSFFLSYRLMLLAWVVSMYFLEGGGLLYIAFILL